MRLSPRRESIGEGTKMERKTTHRPPRAGNALSRPHLVWSVLVTVAVVTLGSWIVSGTARATACDNEAIRLEQGPAASALPACRAYELVSPGSSPLVNSVGGVGLGARAAADGNAMAYLSYYPYEGATSSGWLFRARRGTAGWSLEAMSPQVVPGAAPQVSCEATEVNYSQDLSASVLKIGHDIRTEFPGSSFCQRPQTPIVPDEPVGYANLLRRATIDAPYELLNRTPPASAPANAQFQAASDDLSHVVFGSEALLTGDAPPGYNLYIWSAGSVKLVTALPSGEPVRGDLAGATAHRVNGAAAGGVANGTASITNAVSADGARVFFYANGNLYVRKNPAAPQTVSGSCDASEPHRACTLQVDESRGAGNSGGGIFQYASSDGRRVYFTAESQLTFPSSAAAGKPALYEYDVATRTLADRTLGGSGAADVRGFSGAAKDGSRLYFVARGALTGEQENPHGEVAQAGEPNLYLLANTELSFIATLDGTEDSSAWHELTPVPDGPPTAPGTILATRTSPNGRYFAFNSVRGLAGGPSGQRQIYLYDAIEDTLTCASCLPGSSVAPGPSAIPSPIMVTEGQAPAYLPRGLTDGGQLFFTTTQPLLPSDTDGVADVYEYRPDGMAILSDSAAPGPAYFFDASVDGSDVFFATVDALLRADTDNSLTLYDARVDGGFPEAPKPSPPCLTADTCRGSGTNPPPVSMPLTMLEKGPGNVRRPKPCRAGQVRRKARCVRKIRRGKHRRVKRGQHRKVRNKGERGGKGSRR